MESYFDLGARLGLALLVVLALALLRVSRRLARFEPLVGAREAAVENDRTAGG